jgi:hypothetical protein
MDPLSFQNRTANNQQFQILVDGSDLDSRNRVFLLLPPQVDTTGIMGLTPTTTLPSAFGHLVPTSLTHVTVYYEVSSNSASVSRLDVPAQQRVVVPIFYLTTRVGSHPRAHHFSMIAKKNGQVVGVSMWVLRPPR